MLKKGFTLIELLAVIIILAIVALIATPIILNVIEEARISAGRSEASMIYSGINNYCATEDMKYQLDNSYSKICTTSMNTDTVGQMVNLGKASITSVSYDGTKLTNLVVISNNHTFTLCGDGTFVMDDEECDVDPGTAITTGPLIDILMQQYDENNTVGLVQDEENPNIYYYTGTNEEVSNNYLWYGGHHWRVLEFNISENTLTLISQQPLTSIDPASSIWTSQQTYESSYINNWLNNYFYNSLETSVQNNIQNNTFNVGTYTNVSSIMITEKIGLLDEVQYTKAGGQDSYLNIENDFFLGNTADSLYIRKVSSGNFLGNGRVTSSLGVRPVIKISDIIITGGNGTLEANYEAGNKATNTSDIQVGEYINVPYNGSDNACGTDNKCTFRVISKDNDSIKVTLNGLLSTESIYGDTSTITTSYTIYTALNTFANNISNNYRYTGNKVFYIGEYLHDTQTGQNYTDVQDETLAASVGLPTVGEMFSGNDINMTYSSEYPKIFVNDATIENANTSNNYWLMNRIDYMFVQVIRYSGDTSTNYPDAASGVRPVIFLKNNLTFTSGKGTAESPHELE